MKFHHSRITSQQSKKLMMFFIAGTTARTAAELVGVNRNTVNLFYNKLRKIIVYFIEKESPFFDGEIEVDESYFGGIRKGKRGRGAAGKVPVFGLLKRNGKVYSCIIPNAKEETLIPIIRQKIKPDSIIYSDYFKSYDALDISEFHHHRINHSKLFAKGKNHINGIENCWNQAKRRMTAYNGISKKSFEKFLKESEFKFNNPGAINQLKILEKWCKMYSKQELK
jgi:transposase